MQHATVQPVPDTATRSQPVVDRSGCPGTEHGTELAYSHRGCGCPDAREDHRRKLIARKLYPRTVPAIGATRRLRALAVLGHDAASVAAAAPGLAVATIQRLRSGKPATVSRANHWRVMVAYRHLVHAAPTGLPQFITQTRNIAARENWIGPDEWEPGELDDPAADPRAGADESTATDTAAGPDLLRVKQALAGQLWARDLTLAEIDAAILGLREFRKTREEIAGWLDMTMTQLETAERRITRAALLAQVGDLRAAGYTPEQAVTQLKCDLKTTRELYGWYDRTELEAAVIAGHQAGTSHADTAAATGRTLRDVAHTWAGLYQESFDARVAELRACGLRQSAIAHELGVSDYMVENSYKRTNGSRPARKDVAS